jgi:hypothetical protein
MRACSDDSMIPGAEAPPASLSGGPGGDAPPAGGVGGRARPQMRSSAHDLVGMASDGRAAAYHLALKRPLHAFPGVRGATRPRRGACGALCPVPCGNRCVLTPICTMLTHCGRLRPRTPAGEPLAGSPGPSCMQCLPHSRAWVHASPASTYAAKLRRSFRIQAADASFSQRRHNLPALTCCQHAFPGVRGRRAPAGGVGGGARPRNVQHAHRADASLAQRRHNLPALTCGQHAFPGVWGATRPRRGAWGAAPAHGTCSTRPHARHCQHPSIDNHTTACYTPLNRFTP